MALAVFSNYNIQSLWYTNNGGSTWANVEGNLTGANAPSIRWAEIFYISSTMQIILGTSTGIYYTAALNGTSTVWTQEAVSSIGNVVCVHMDFRPADNMLVVGTHGRGSFQTHITAPISVQTISSEVPSAYSLSQNFPNPFNPSTRIHYSIPRVGFVRLIVFDILGKEITTLVNESQRAGVYETTFNASQYPSGVYFYRLTTDGFRDTKKMILIK
jgi:hypothetical protein